MSGATWVIDVHIATTDGAVKLTASTRRRVHVVLLDLLTVASVREAVAWLVAKHGAPAAILTDHGTLFSGLGEALGIEQRFPTAPGNPTWLRRLLARAAA